MKRFILGALLLAAAHVAAAGDKTPADGLLSEEAGARVISFSSEFGSGWEAAALVKAKRPDDADATYVEPSIWSSASEAPFPHWILFGFDDEKTFETFVFDNFLSDEADHPGISAREIEIWVGEAEEKLAKVASFELERNATGQSVRIEPVKGRFLKLQINSNWGHPWYTELGHTRILPPDEPEVSLADRMKADGKVDLYGLYFDFGSARLRPESAAVLDQIMALHAAEPEARFMVEGHTDAIGSPEANLALSRARAEAVVAALLVRGATDGVFTPVGYGMDHPVSDNETDVGRARNRRVTLRLQTAAGE